jgi:hypothetical protein
MSFWRDIGEVLGVVAERSEYDPYPKPRDNRACYHAKRRGDCWSYQQGKCTCQEEARQ